MRCREIIFLLIIVILAVPAIAMSNATTFTTPSAVTNQGRLFRYLDEINETTHDNYDAIVSMNGTTLLEMKQEIEDFNGTTMRLLMERVESMNDTTLLAIHEDIGLSNDTLGTILERVEDINDTTLQEIRSFIENMNTSLYDGIIAIQNDVDDLNDTTMLLLKQDIENMNITIDVLLQNQQTFNDSLVTIENNTVYIMAQLDDVSQDLVTINSTLFNQIITVENNLNLINSSLHLKLEEILSNQNDVDFLGNFSYLFLSLEDLKANQTFWFPEINNTLFALNDSLLSIDADLSSISTQLTTIDTNIDWLMSEINCTDFVWEDFSLCYMLNETKEEIIDILNNLNTAPTAVTLLTPLNTSTSSDLTPTFTWSGGDDSGDFDNKSSTYHIFVSNDSAFSDIVFSDQTANSFYTLSTNLTDGSTYWWKVTATDGVFNVTADSFTFDTDVSSGTAVVVVPVESGGRAWRPSDVVDVVTVSVCGDGVCSEDETLDLCPEDCEPPERDRLLYWIFILIFAVLLLGLYLVTIINRRNRHILS